MGLFSNVFDNKQSKKILNTNSPFENIISELNENIKTEKIAKQIQFNLSDSNSKKEDYLLILNNLNDIIKKEEEKQKFKNQLYEIKNDFNALKGQTFLSEVKDFENFALDFDLLELEFKFLNSCDINLKNIFENLDLKQTYNEYKILYKSYLKSKSESEELILQEQDFTNEIMKFASTIKELEQKYRLSIDWDGKKPAMIAYRKKLVEKRDLFLKKEKEQNEKIKLLYATYTLLNKKLKYEYNYLNDFINKEIDFFNEDIIDVQSLNNLFSKLKENIENNL